MTKRIDKKLYSFDDHPEHQQRLDEWAQRWIANALSTTPADQERMRVAMTGLYQAADLVPPSRGSFVQSPMTAAIAGTIASGVWWLRENPSEHQGLFGRQISEEELMAAIPIACQFSVEHGMATLTGDKSLVKMALSATRSATYSATYSATGSATDSATRSATGSATYSATRSATDSATYSATGSATYSATGSATYSATRSATGSATYSATDSATGSATYSATDSATYSATDSATYSATRSATGSATYSATRSATDSATDSATQIDSTVVRFLVRCTRFWWKMHDGGSDWSAWPAYLSFFRHVAELNLPIYEKWQHYEDAASYGASRIMHEQFWIVSDRQTSIHLDQDNELHCEDGPARTWGDGWAVWYWHGTAVPRDLIEGDGWDLDRIVREENTEVRRCAIERNGWDWFIESAGLTPVGEPKADPGNFSYTWVASEDETGEPCWDAIDPVPRMVSLYDLPTDLNPYPEPVRILMCTNGTPERDGTHKRFGLTVPATIDDPVEAAAWTYGKTVEEYVLVARRT